MRARALTFLAAALVACASAPPPPTLPPAVDIDTLLPPRPPLPVLPEGLADGPDRNVDEGQCRGLPAGILVSEKKFAERELAVAERDRLRVEVDARVKLRQQERQAALDLQAAYQQQLAGAIRGRTINLWLGMAIGAGAILAGAWAAGHVGR